MGMMDMATVEQGINTKTKIIETAIGLAAKYGIEGLTIRDICKNANISIGAFYHHFRSKEELMDESFVIYDQALELNLKKYSDKDPVEALKGILLDQTDFVINIPKKLIIEYYKAILSAANKGAVNTQRNYYKSVYHYVARAQENHLFKQKYSIEYITEFYIKFVRGNIIDWCLHDFSYNILKQTSNEIDLITKIFINK